MRLRRLQHSDLKPTFDMRNDPTIYKWCRQNAPLHWDNHVKWYEWQSKDPATSMFAIVGGSDVPVGVCGLTSIDYVNSRAEFSLYIGHKYQGRGHAKFALKSLIKYGFEDLGLNSIWGESFEGNQALGLFKKLGFVEEGRRRDFYYRSGRFIDAILVSITRHDFFSEKTLARGPTEDDYKVWADPTPDGENESNSQAQD